MKRVLIAITLSVSLTGPGAMANGQETVPELSEDASKTLDAIEADFEDSLKDLGELAGEVYACEEDAAKRTVHENRIKSLFGEINELFGTDRGFLFAVSVGYGAASTLEADVCKELTDEFEDRYGVMSEKYDLVD